jgi:hypothetical protein
MTTWLSKSLATTLLFCPILVSVVCANEAPMQTPDPEPFLAEKKVAIAIPGLVTSLVSATRAPFQFSIFHLLPRSGTVRQLKVVQSLHCGGRRISQMITKVI